MTVSQADTEVGRLGGPWPATSLGMYAQFEGESLRVLVASHQRLRPGVREILSGTVVLTVPELTYTNTSGVCEIEVGTAEVWKVVDSQMSGTRQTTWAMGTLWCTDLTEVRSGDLVSFEARFRVATEVWLDVPQPIVLWP